MRIEEHNHCFMRYFGVKPLSGTLFPPPLVNAGYGARLGDVRDKTALAKSEDLRLAYQQRNPAEPMEEQGCLTEHLRVFDTLYIVI